jgi:hypothetical protein
MRNLAASDGGIASGNFVMTVLAQKQLPSLGCGDATPGDAQLEGFTFLMQI